MSRRRSGLRISVCLSMARLIPVKQTCMAVLVRYFISGRGVFSPLYESVEMDSEQSASYGLDEKGEGGPQVMPIQIIIICFVDRDSAAPDRMYALE